MFSVPYHQYDCKSYPTQSRRVRWAASVLTPVHVWMSMNCAVARSRATTEVGVAKNDPRQLHFPFALWTSVMVGELIRRQFGIRVIRRLEGARLDSAVLGTEPAALGEKSCHMFGLGFRPARRHGRCPL